MSNPANQTMASSSANTMTNTQGTNNPKLQSVNYVTILPEGKTSGYKPEQQIDFKIDPIQFPYIDGKQSYLLLNIEPTGTFSNANATADVPLMFVPNMGANSIVNRLTCRLNDGTGKIIEDRESYNLYNGIMNSYAHDSDVFPSLAKVEGVSGRTSHPVNRTIDNINNTYFYPLPDISTTTNTAAGGNSLLAQNSFVIPIQLGLFSAFGNQHQAVPNMDIGGCHLTYYLERANRCLQTLCHKFYRTSNVNNVSVDAVFPIEFTDPVEITFTSTTEFNVKQTDCDCNLTIGDEPWTIDKCAWRVGMPLKIGSNSAVSLIDSIEIDGGLIKVTLDQGIGAVGDDTVQPDDISKRDYSISKVELRVLNTMPDAGTMKDIRRSVMRGINFNSTQLYKVSTASALKNAVVDIPESLTKCLSIMAVPCQQSNLDTVDGQNSYNYPRPDSMLNVNNNDYTYQWLVRQILIPNLAVVTNKLVDAKSDNTILFNQLLMAMRPMYNVRSLEDNKLNQTHNNQDLNLPYFFPLSLAPMGSSFDLIDSAPQLRVENVDSATTTAKLYHIFVNHVRMLKGSDASVDIEF
jgi:hypothetical protein